MFLAVEPALRLQLEEERAAVGTKFRPGAKLALVEIAF
jgi:hypothetical protein